MSRVPNRTDRAQRWSRTLRAAILGAAMVASLAAIAEAGGSIGPDVTVFDLPNTSNYGLDGGIRAYSVGTTSCNVGDEPVWWCNDEGDPYCETNQHPVIAQNLYRLKEGRFEQLGMSWLKHGFLSVNGNHPGCGTCVDPPHGGDQLGVGCIDPYGSGLNGNRPLGMRSEVNATSGDFPYPYTQVSFSSLIDQRVQVAESDLDPALNPGARYWIEGHYIAADDARAGNALNNASHREVTVEAGTFDLEFAGPTIREQPAIHAWKGVDPGVELLDLDVAGALSQRFHLARRVSGIPGGGWHYEYAIHNLNSDRSGQAFEVQFPGPTLISDAGFRDVDHHSGEPYDTTDWEIMVDSGAGTVSWSTDLAAGNPDANALRWGTMFTFWFDADAGPGELVHTLALFKSGVPTSLVFTMNEVFADGFESGDTSAWSASQP